VLASWSPIRKRVKEYYLFLLLLQLGMLGVFVALDAFLFFTFWEVMLVPMYFLIGIWGSENRLYAAYKFFLYTAAGSAFILVALVRLFFANGRSFDMTTMSGLGLPGGVQWWVFLALAVGFAVKVPMVPFHTWLPDAHGQAPTAGSVLLAGVLLKMGTYGFVRFAIPMLPEPARACLPLLLALCAIGVVHGALTAMAQQDMKQLVAYSSISHLGLVMLGIFCLNPAGLTGGLLQMLNHGLSTGALFLLVGMLYERRHTKRIDDFGGIARPMPLFAAIFVIVTMSSIGLPGLNGFVGELPILVGAAELVAEDPAWIGLLVVAASGMVLGAGYMLWLVRRVLFGPLRHAENASLPDVRVGGAEMWSVAPLVVLCVAIGLYPRPLLEILEPPVRRLVAQARPEHGTAPPVEEVVTTAAPAAPGGGGRH
jgi:NADH-quinone oxidoreductase subunit M